MNILSLLAAILAGAYGLLSAFAGWSQIRAGAIQRWAAASMIASGLVLVISAGLLVAKSPIALLVLIIGLLAMHILAINNGLKMHGRLTPSHHIARLVLSLLIIGLAIPGGR